MEATAIQNSNRDVHDTSTCHNESEKIINEQIANSSKYIHRNEHPLSIKPYVMDEIKAACRYPCSNVVPNGP